MAIYNEIISWSSNKSFFVKDALRRLITSPSLSNTDIDDLTDLLKKDVGFTGIVKVAVPITTSHIPAMVSSGVNVASLISIEKPININSLYDKAKIDFANTGLNVVYGNNGSGKSSYAKILKKLCWSRHKNIELKTNVYTKDTRQQSIDIVYESNSISTPYTWNNSQPNNSDLNTIFIFDTACANIYLNNENPTEYKPAGIDILERLIDVFVSIGNKINAEIAILNTQKPILDSAKFNGTQISNWYQTMEKLGLVVVQTKLQFTQENRQRKTDLLALLNSTNPVQQKQILQQKISRYKIAVNEINTNLKLFSPQAIDTIINLKQDYVNKYNTYQTAQQSISGNYPLSGVGSETWRIMWEAAKQFAIHEIHPQNVNFPSEKSNEYCVLCQQELNTAAADRLNKFNQFINDTTSQAYNEAKNKLENTELNINKLVVNVTETYNELENDIIDFKVLFYNFIQEFNNAKNLILEHLKLNHQNPIQQLDTVTNIALHIQSVINRLEQSIADIDKLTANRNVLELELLELEGLEILANSNSQIFQYHSEFQVKSKLQKCISELNTTGISRKIGEVLETEAIVLQQVEFIKHLKALNVNIANKVSITKTRTSSGKTYQRCGFNNINESISNILSEGEQKVVALANFLSECTIDNRTNTIVFDDPVTSLDQDYREAIAKILVSLSINRQVIILTHDLYFVRLLLEIHKKKFDKECHFIGVENVNGIAGVQAEETPYLGKNVVDRISSIDSLLKQIKGLAPTSSIQRNTLLESARGRFRLLIEKSVEELLATKSIERFSKNIDVKLRVLSGFVVVEHTDIVLLCDLFGKYSQPVHDGSDATIPQLPNEQVITEDLKNFKDWSIDFKKRLLEFRDLNNISK